MTYRCNFSIAYNLRWCSCWTKFFLLKFCCSISNNCFFCFSNNAVSLSIFIFYCSSTIPNFFLIDYYLSSSWFYSIYSYSSYFCIISLWSLSSAALLAFYRANFVVLAFKRSARYWQLILSSCDIIFCSFHYYSYSFFTESNLTITLEVFLLYWLSASCKSPYF